MIQGIQSGEIDKWWVHVEPLITKALKYGIGEYTSEDIKQACEQQIMQLWVYADKKNRGVFVTQILNYPQLNVLLVLLLSGDNFKEWRDEVDDLLLRFGKEKDCKYVELFGRKGWGKAFLSDINYKEQVRMFSKEIL